MKHSGSIDSKVLARVYGLGRGSVFTPERFQDLGGPKAVLHALARHTDAGTIRRLARGLYDYPKKHPKLGLLEPSTDEIAENKFSSSRMSIDPIRSGANAAKKSITTPSLKRWLGKACSRSGSPRWSRI